MVGPMECPNCRTAAYRSRLDEYESLYFHTHHLHRLRTTNEPPSEDEADYVHNTVLCAIQDDTDNVDARLVELQSAANALIQERNRLVQYANGFKLLLSPIRRLPPELLMEIFQHACARHGWLHFFHRAHMHWVIPQVCRKWRTIALSCPPLWSSIVAVLRPTFPPTSTLDAILHRSGTHPINIRVLVGDNHYDDPHVRDLIAPIRAHSSRWRSLRATLPYFATDFTLDILQGSYPFFTD
ncbi:hypothetical protein BDZ89DRAFT_350718 [Hymenopellis radicata]|nr:hypothetical protein BDZ89DRAFT_350718 [Hymenopellis radicata]